MGIIKKSKVEYVVSKDEIKALIAKDLGVDPKNVIVRFTQEMQGYSPNEHYVISGVVATVTGD